MFEKLAEEMKRQNISGYALAARAGITKQDFYKARAGHIPFYPGWKKRIAEALNVSPEEIFQEE